MRVFITGAGGFIGRALAARLTARGDVVTGVDLVPGPGVVPGDITRPGVWQDGLKGADAVVHTAAIVSNAAGMDAQWRVNTVGTRRVLDAAVRAGVPRFVLLSSVRAFSDTGFPDGVTEDHPVRPDGNPYVDTKIACEQVALQAHAAGETARRAASGRRGTGVHAQRRHRRDLQGLLRALLPDARQARAARGADRRRAPGRPGGPALARVAGVRSELNPVSLRYLTRTGTYSIAKARRTLGYQPAVGLADGMERTRTWLAERGLVPAR
ncbi:NAD-dependent epimerase/dehydratase family protein [Actinomadura rayongensis]|uniref:NAD-dependent epimerase/dehydratase family protein n=1 Tax=Actinomadura rayongensis TaxID=1429076 RepID=UPI00192662E6|nr:NAD(P)-dependent oxidoreductase [Actinomadura rayongensis]